MVESGKVPEGVVCNLSVPYVRSECTGNLFLSLGLFLLVRRSGSHCIPVRRYYVYIIFFYLFFIFIFLVVFPIYFLCFFVLFSIFPESFLVMSMLKVTNYTAA